MIFVLAVSTTGVGQLPTTPDVSYAEQERAGIVEIAGCYVREDLIVSEFTTPVWPGREYLQMRHRDYLRERHGIDANSLLEISVPSVFQAREMLISWLYGEAGVKRCNNHEAWKDPDVIEQRLTVTSYNTRVEGPLLRNTPWQLDWFVRAQAKAYLSWGSAIMPQVAQRAGASSPTVSLDTARRFLRVPAPENGRALSEARAAAAMLIALGVGEEMLCAG